MGDGRTPPVTPDLFSTPSGQEPPVPSTRPSKSSDATPSQRHVLPKDLCSAIKQLTDDELGRLIAAALAERQRRGGTRAPVREEPWRKPRAQTIGTPLTTSKLNAVRAAFRAGVKPKQIGRQFGLSDADVRKALAGDDWKR